MASLANKVALVTGASRGIGRAVALSLAHEGAAVAVNYRERAADAGEVVASIRNAGGRAMAVAADVSDSAAVSAMMAVVERELAGG
jgi:3-oxoacyl-[acyl-carrier protein] reductase